MTTQSTQIGTVIHGTLRPQDLIPAFIDELRTADPTAYAQLLINGGGIPAYVFDDGDDCEWWLSPEAHWLLEGLFDELNECAPEGCYFGAHPGDGSDFGYWEFEE